MQEVMRLFDYIVDMRKNKRAKRVAFMLIGLVLIGCAALAYRWLVSWRTQSAQEAFSKQYEIYEKALASESGPNWHELAEQWDAAYKKQASSVFAPSFLAYKAQAQAQAGQRDEAMNTLAAAIALVPQRSDFAYLYATTQALMEIDSPDGAVHDTGLAALEKLAHDPHNTQWDRAAYYYGLYSALAGDTDKAIAEWSVLVNKAPRASAWVDLARKQLAQRAPMAIAQVT